MTLNFKFKRQQCNFNFRIKGMYGQCITHQTTKATMHSTLSSLLWANINFQKVVFELLGLHVKMPSS